MFFPWFEVWVWLLTSAVAFGAMVVWGIARIRYRLGPEALEIVVLGVPFRSIPYAGIETVERGGSLWNEHWVSFRLGNRVTLRLREGRRPIVITPPDPPAFLRELESRIRGDERRDRVAGYQWPVSSANPPGTDNR
jgi:hypothetical protein